MCLHKSSWRASISWVMTALLVRVANSTMPAWCVQTHCRVCLSHLCYRPLAGTKAYQGSINSGLPWCICACCGDVFCQQGLENWSWLKEWSTVLKTQGKPYAPHGLTYMFPTWEVVFRKQVCFYLSDEQSPIDGSCQWIGATIVNCYHV